MVKTKKTFFNKVLTNGEFSIIMFMFNITKRGIGCTANTFQHWLALACSPPDNEREREEIGLFCRHLWFD